MKRTTIFSLLVLISFEAWGMIPKPMNPPQLVNDFASLFSAHERDSLEKLLREYHDSTSTQIYIVTVETLDGMAPYEYATAIGQEWGAGQKEKDNGIVMLLKPRNEYGKGEVFIAVGYGIEPILNAGRIGRIIDSQMMPHLSTGNYYKASKCAVDEMILYLSGEFRADDDDDLSTLIWALLLLLIPVVLFFYLVYRIIKGMFRGGGRSSGGNYNSRMGSRSSYRSSGRSSRSSSGSSFRGGGGGSFGGGGAGRSF